MGKVKPSVARRMGEVTIRAGHVPIFLGPPGEGKTAIMNELTKIFACGREIVKGNTSPRDDQFGDIDFRLSLYESPDLGGAPVPVEQDDGTYVQRRAFLENLPVSGSGMLKLDEYPQAEPDVMSIAAQLVYERRLGDYKVPDGWKIMCAGNKSGHRAGASKITTNFMSRVNRIDFACDTNEWLDWAVEHDVNPDIMGFISFQPELLSVFDPKVVDPQPNPRSWKRFSDTLYVNPDSDLIAHLAESSTGEVAATEFCTFISLKDNVPDLSKIVAGEEIEMPVEPGMMYATIVALITVIRESSDLKVREHFENSLAFIENFPTPEYSIFFVRSIVKSIPDLRNTSAFGSFKERNQELEV